jgi:hypothetical protein
VIIPDWLHNIFLGYGDPGAAHYSALPDRLDTLDFKDTFLDAGHLDASFPHFRTAWTNGTRGSQQPLPPYRVAFPQVGWLGPGPAGLALCLGERGQTPATAVLLARHSCLGPSFPPDLGDA